MEASPGFAPGQDLSRLELLCGVELGRCLPVRSQSPDFDLQPENNASGDVGPLALRSQVGGPRATSRGLDFTILCNVLFRRIMNDGKDPAALARIKRK